MSKKTIVDAVLGGARTVDEVSAATRAGTGCGGCRELCGGIVDWLNATDPQTESGSDTSAEPASPFESQPVGSPA